MSLATNLFRAKAPGIMRLLMQDFPRLQAEDATAIVGNLGHECLGFSKMQEISPTVAGSRGGYGWAQWTGPRRRAFEDYCKRNHLDPSSDKANYAWLWVELTGSEAGAIAKTVAATGLDAKVKAFERAYLRAGVPHYDSRLQWATIAADAYSRAMASAAAAGTPTPVTPLVEPADRTGAIAVATGHEVAARDKALGGAAGSGVAGTLTTTGAMANGQGLHLAEWLLIGGVVALLLGAAFFAWRASRGHQAGIDRLTNVVMSK